MLASYEPVMHAIVKLELDSAGSGTGLDIAAQKWIQQVPVGYRFTMMSFCLSRYDSNTQSLHGFDSRLVVTVLKTKSRVME